MLRLSQRFYTEKDRQAIIKLLIEMRQAGYFRAIWCDEDRLRVLLPDALDRTRMSWQWAARLTKYKPEPETRQQKKAWRFLGRIA